MASISEGCRLCLDPFAECFTTIENPQLKEQMGKVFCFPIEPKPGYCSSVCHSCSYSIAEFYQYSEKVRQNQEVLNGKATNYDPTVVNSEVVFEIVKVETPVDLGLPEEAEDTCEPKHEVSAEDKESMVTLERVKVEPLSDSGFSEMAETGACDSRDKLPEDEEEEEEYVPSSGDDETYEPSPKKTQTKRKGRHGKRKRNGLKADKPKKNFTQTPQERHEEDLLFNKHYSMICDVCGTPTGTFTELLSHFWKVHKTRFGYVMCCNKKLSKRYIMRDHIVFHANPDVFRCEMCGNRYMSKDTLDRHILLMHAVSTEESNVPLETVKVEPLSDARFAEMTQDVCGGSRNEFSEVEVPSSGNDELYEPAPKKSGTERKRRRRISDKPKNYFKQQRYEEDLLFNKHFSMICDLCGTTAANYTALLSHFWKEHKTRVGYLVCCNKKLFKRHTIKEHIEYHANPDVFRCEVCGNKYMNKHTLDNHMLLKHSGAGPFQCDHCTESFGHESALAEHMRRHVKIKCPKCDRVFARKNSLKYHTIKRHSDTDRVQEFLSKQNFERKMNGKLEVMAQQSNSCPSMNFNEDPMNTF